MKNKELIEKLVAKKAGKVKSLLQKEWNISARLYRQLAQEKAISLNGKLVESNHVVQEGDCISVVLGYEENTYPFYPMELEILYEDPYLLVINKDRGLVVHPTRGTKEPTLLHGISFRMVQRGEDYKIRFGNRIDRDTSGIVIIAKNKFAHHQFSLELENRRVYKEYFAFVEGYFDKRREVRERILGLEGEARRIIHPQGQDSTTFIEPIYSTESMSLVRAVPVTGRTHQIRVHLASLAHPIVGDTLYGSCYREPLLLHAYGVKFLHPFTKEILQIQAPLKEDMKRTIKELEVKNEK